MSKIDKPKLILGGIFEDHRGEMSFVNDFKVNRAKRFYTIKHTDKNIVRAWQGHELESKYFFPLDGKFLIAWVQLDNFENPNQSLRAKFVILDANEPAILAIPAGYANGLKCITNNARVGVFSGFELEKSIEEKRRYDAKLWFNWEQDFENNECNQII